MADIRCPMCGNANPDHLEVCQFCQARLTPLIGGHSKSPIGGEPADEASDSDDDWLMALRAGDGPSDFSDEDAAAGNADIPDWLRDLGSGDAEDDRLPSEENRGSERGLQDDSETTSAAEPPDWLQQTRFSEPLSLEDEVTETDGEVAPDVADADAVEETDLLSWGNKAAPRDDADEAPDMQAQTAASAADEIPDWLAQLDPVDEAASAGSALGWLSELEQPEPSAAPEEETPAGEGALPEWLSGLDVGDADKIEPEPDLQPADPAPPVSVEPEELPAWLTEFDAVETAAGIPEETVIAETPEEISDIREDVSEEMEDVQAPAEEAAPAWLAEIEAADAETEETPTGEESPDWLGEYGSATTVEESGDLPGWLIELEAEPDTTADAEADAAPTGEKSADLPDWLAELEAESDELLLEPGISTRQEDAPETSAAPDWLEEFEAPDEDEIPGWLTDTSVSAVEKTPTPIKPDDEAWDAGFIDEEAPEPILAEELTDWPDDTAPAEESVEEGELPPWLDEFESVDVEDATEAAEEDSGDELPAWLSSALGPALSDEDDDSFVPPAPVEEELEPELEDWLAAMSDKPTSTGQDVPSAEMPQWLTEFEETPGEIPAAESASADMPDWLQNLQERSAGEVEFDGEEWVTPELTAEQEEEEQPDAVDWLPAQDSEFTIDMLARGEGIEEGLAPGQLPEWLKAMRPEERAAAGMMEAGEYDTGAVERAGPLAGLRGVLSAEPSATQAGKTPAQFIRLQINDLQQGKADQLQKMVSAELAPPPLKRSPVLSEQRVLRYIIASLLLFIAAFPLFLPGDLAPLPPKPIEMQRVDLLISGLNTTSNVLIVLDYQPGMSGEMDAAASAVLDHLMLQQPKLALVSTHLTGPALAERFVRVVEGQHSYAAGEQYVNLGYLPGDSTGLLLFAENPAAAVKLGYDDRPIWALLDPAANDPWQQPALQGIDSLDDFSLTLLLSDDPDTIRRWIEQVSPAMRSGSLIVISSAQAEPLVRPYYDAQTQVTALVPGLPGGAAYEGFLLRPGPARAAWDAYSLGSLIAIILILGAGTYNLYFLWKERESEKRGRT